ncbi:MAG: hypothetical protein ACLPVY_03775 [Acidimicrobiia bacterium]
MPLTDQLVVLDGRADDGALATLARIRGSSGLVLRDAAVLRSKDGTMVVTVPTDDWQCRRPLGPRWWTALARTVTRSPDRDSRALIDAGVSRSFLEELAEALQSGYTAVVLLAEQVEIGLLRRDAGGAEKCVRVIYGSFPESAINDVTDQTRRGSPVSRDDRRSIGDASDETSA